MAVDTNGSIVEDDGYVPMRARFNAWWNGDDIALVRQAGQSVKGMAIGIENMPDSDEDVDEDEDEPNLWSAARLSAIQSVWGEGFTEPGGAKFSKKLLGWLGLNSRQSVLDLTAGLGGTARSMASAQNLWMGALEPIAELAIEGRRQSIAAGLGRQVPIAAADLETHEFTKGRYDAIYSRERLFAVRKKAKVLSNCAEALKAKGQILITDYVRHQNTGGAELAACWGRHEKVLPSAWTMKAYIDCLRELELNVLTAQDITEEMINHITTAWRRVPDLIAKGTLSHRQVGYLVNEGEIWMDRLQAMENGQLIVARIHAQKINA